MYIFLLVLDFLVWMLASSSHSLLMVMPTPSCSYNLQLLIPSYKINIRRKNEGMGIELCFPRGLGNKIAMGRNLMGKVPMMH